jgi:hypothetical protein
MHGVNKACKDSTSKQERSSEETSAIYESNCNQRGRAIAQAVSRRLPIAAARV